MHESKPPLPPLPSSTPRCPSPAVRRGNGRPPFAKRMASGSPLRTVEISRTSPTPQRPLLSARASTVSRTSNLPTSPLDDIPAQLWPRILRMSSTPETTGPELSIDEITSTRLSLDDQDILTNLPEESDLKETHSRKLVLKTALSSVWGEHSDKLKRMTKRLKKLPNGIFARRDPLERELTTMMNPAPLREPTLPCIDFATDLFVPTTGRMPSIEETEGVDQPETLMDYECKPMESESCSDEMSKISNVIRKDLHEASNEGRLLRPLSAGNAERPYTYAASSATVNSSHTAVDRLLHGHRSLRASTRQGMGRTSSIGSVEEMRSHAFGSRRISRPSLSSVSFRHSCAPSVSRSSQSVSRPATNAGSASSTNGTLALRRPVAYMDMPNHSTNFTWTGLDLRERPSTASTARPVSRGVSGLNPRDSHVEALANLFPEVERGLGDIPGYIKVPICAPRRIERNHGSQRLEPHPPILVSLRMNPRALNEDSPDGDMASTLKESSPADSDISCASVQGQTSIQSHAEREALLRESDKESGSNSCSGGRDRLSRALSTAWTEGASRLWQKGCRKQSG